MEELKSPSLSCPNTVTVRRNPPRRARPTPYSVAPSSSSKPPPSSSAIRSFPINDILSINIPEPPSCSENQPQSSEKLKVFLRIRPPIVVPTQHKPQSKNAWPQNPSKKNEGSRKATDSKNKNNKKNISSSGEDACLKVIDSYSVTLCPPQSVVDVRRTKSEVYQGFSYVFSPQSTQNEVYDKMVNPLVDDFLNGRSGMLAAMGPSGSGKTHTVFGTNRDPGMVSLALRQIFLQNKGKVPKISRTFYLSMFEIYSERGKGEKIMDLSHEGGDVYLQQSNIKGLQEVVIYDVQQAECLIASGMLRRSTAMTNSNIQSSRSQCIINIRSGLDNLDGDAAAQSCTATLTIVDLAGAEREKKTGNQGARLLESNFINNTSMVFGLCLRSLLEHQKNLKKPFHKHFQNSLLTKYLRDFLEGKKRMALILTAKPGEDDYQDTSYLLRQAAPFMNIKFENVEEQPANTLGNKRRTQALLKAEQVKRMKLTSIEVSTDDEVKCGDHCEPHKEDPVSIDLELEENNLCKENITSSLKRPKKNNILLNISIAMWNVLKQCKQKLQASEHEVDTLRRSLTIAAKKCTALEIKLNLAKASCSCGKEVVSEFLEKFDQVNIDQELSSVEVVSISSDLEKFEVQRNEKVDASTSSPNVVVGKQEFTEVEKRETTGQLTGCDNIESAVCDSELLVLGENISSVVKSTAQVSSSNPSEAECLEKHDVLDDTGVSSVEVVSISSDPEKLDEQSNEIVDVSSPISVCDKQILRDVGEVTGRDTLDPAGQDSELPCIVGDEISLSLVEDQPEQEEKEGVISVEVASISSDTEKFDELSNEIVDVSSPSSVCDKKILRDVEEREANGEITGCDTLDPAGQDSELPCIVGDEISLSLVENQPEQEEKEVSLTYNIHQIVDVSSPSSVCDKKILRDVVEREANGEITDPAGQDSELPCVVVDEISLSLVEDHPEQEEKEGVISVEVASISSDPEKFDELSNEIADVSSPSSVCDKKILWHVEEREANGEITGCDTLDPAGQDSELPCIVGDEISLSLVEDQPEQEKKEVNVPRSSSVLDVSKCEQNIQLLDSTDVPDQQLVLPNDVISSQKSNASKFREAPSVQPCQSSSVKPKRRLRPASSLMLRNINVSDFDEVTEMPKHGKRGQKENVVDKRTQDGISLLRLLNPNLHR